MTEGTLGHRIHVVRQRMSELLAHGEASQPYLKETLQEALAALDAADAELSVASQRLDQEHQHYEECSRARRTLNTSEVYERTIARNPYDWELWRDPQSRVVFCSPSCERITGYRPDEYLADQELLLNITHPDDHALYAAHLDEHARARVPGELQFRVIHRNGEVRWLDHTCQPIYEDDGVFRGTRVTNRDITRRKRAEEALNENQQRLHGLIDNSLDGIVLLDERGLVVEWNAGQERITGIPRGEMLGQSLADIQLGLPSSEQQSVPVAAWLKHLARQMGHTGQLPDPGQYAEHVILRPDGEQRTVQSLVYTIETAKGHCIGSIARDITVRRRAEAERERLFAEVREAHRRAEELARALQTERDVLQAVMENTRTSLAYLDADLRFVNVNSAYTAGSGHSREELLGHNHFELFPNEENEAIFRQARDTGQPVEFRARPFVFADQPERGITYWDWTLIPIPDESGQTRGLVLSLADVTQVVYAAQERERLIAALALERARLATLLEQLPVGVAMLDASTGERLLSNPQASAIWGYSHPVPLNTEHNTMRRGFHPDGRPYRDEEWPISRSVRTGELVRDEEIEILRFDGTRRVLSGSSAPIRDREGRIVAGVVVFQDVTVRKDMETALRLSRDALEQRVQERTAELSALNAIVVAANSSLDLRQTFANLQAVLAKELPTCQGALFSYHAEGDLLRQEACWGLPDELASQAKTLSAEPYHAGEVLAQAEHVVGSVLGASPLLRDANCLGIPLVVAGQLQGALCLFHPSASPPDERQLVFYTTMAQEVAAAVQNSRLYEQAHTSREQLQSLSRRLVEVQELERRTIAGELHDEIGQLLTALNLAIEMSRRASSQSAQSSMERARFIVSELMGRVRQMSLDLRPGMLDDLGLLPALLWHLDRYTQQTGIAVHLEQAGIERRFLPEVETAAYRIIQEALTNVARHAGVQEVTARLWVSGGVLSLQIEDRGQGFDPQQALADPRSSGLVGMRERALLLGGKLAIASTPHGGTCLTAELPLGDAEP